ncbi:hypothetical protein HAX54_025480 [Datura stramonium]|uniref:Uncharacterized protein n=1 Tax=Datura stramonium TaxID=4076 RepID=A0ABS8UZS4_DATST|nr:hypothetical protein [Datura stramonium]
MKATKHRTFNASRSATRSIKGALSAMMRSKLRMNGVTKEQLQQLNMDNPLSEHSRALCRVGPGFEEPLDDDVATEDEMARVDSDMESSDDNEEDSEMGEASLAPTDDEE